jgi:N-acetylmuramoyl-L-alanine amidase
VAYAQSALETGFGNFGGVINASFRNSCGLKTTQGGGNDDPNAHQRFPSWYTGVIACIDHLALYAGAPGYPKASTPDPRHFPSVYGTAPTVERLGGRWAPSPTYGTRIVRDLLNPMLAT